VWWLQLPDAKSRPVLVISRDVAIATMRRVVVVLITRNLRRGPSQLPLGRDEGLLTESVANFDDVMTVPKAMLVRRLGALGRRLPELCATLRRTADC
jgi:mRNA-degrading endonuclease toxin of MazEF toxin-antitoxin module